MKIKYVKKITNKQDRKIERKEGKKKKIKNEKWKNENGSGRKRHW